MGYGSWIINQRKTLFRRCSFYNRLSEQVVRGLSVDKLITENWPCIFAFYCCFLHNVVGRIYHCPWIKAIAARDQFQRFQISAKRPKLKR